MPEIVPSAEQMTMLVGKPLYEIWTQLCALIDEKYDGAPVGQRREGMDL